MGTIFKLHQKPLVRAKVGFSCEISPPSIRRRSWTPWGSKKLGSRGCYRLLRSLASIYVIFGPLDLLPMVAEAPDHHGGGPGRVGDGKNDLNGAHILYHGEVGYIIFIYALSLIHI